MLCGWSPPEISSAEQDDNSSGNTEACLPHSSGSSLAATCVHSQLEGKGHLGTAPSLPLPLKLEGAGDRGKAQASEVKYRKKQHCIFLMFKNKGKKITLNPTFNCPQAVSRLSPVWAMYQSYVRSPLLLAACCLNTLSIRFVYNNLCIVNV